MIETLEQLAQYIRETLPQPKSIVNLQAKDKTDVVTFHWQGREFLVKKSLDVLEVRSNNLYITGASMLLQSVLTKKGRNEKVIESVLDALKQAEDLISSKRQTESGLKLLGTVKSTLSKLAAK